MLVVLEKETNFVTLNLKQAPYMRRNEEVEMINVAFYFYKY